MKYYYLISIFYKKKQQQQQQITNKKNFFFNFQIFENLTTTTLTLIFIDFLITYKLIKLESLKDEEIYFLFHFY